MLALDRALGTRLAQRPRFWAFLGIMLLCQLAFDGYLTARPVTLYADPCCHLGPRLPLLNMPIEDLPFGLPLSASLPSSGNGQETPSNVQQRTGEQAMNHHDTQTFVTQLSSIRNPQSAIHNRVPHAPNPPHHPHRLAPDLLVQHRLCVRGRGLRRGQRLKERRNLLALAYFTLPYNLALYGINDIRDYPSDKLNPRKNSVEGGLLPPETHRPVLAWIAALNAPILPVLLAHGDRRANGVLAFLQATTIAYSAPPLRLKEVPGLDSFISATHYVTPFVYGLALNHAQNYPRQEIAASSPGAWPPSPSARSRTSNSTARAASTRSPPRSARVAPPSSPPPSTCSPPCSRSPDAAPRAASTAGALALLPYAANTALFLRNPQPAHANCHWRTFLKLNLPPSHLHHHLPLGPDEVQTLRLARRG
ncbi:MAG: hypothetical protein U0232_07185 [Thermomicrobiales bacterium]